MTEWRVVPGFSDYEVSEDGQLRRLTAEHGTQVGRILKPRAFATGYIHYGLCRKDQDGKPLPYKRITAHRLVALAFLGAPPSPRHHVAHGDGTRSHNHYTNLRWATPKENMADAIRHGTTIAGEKHPGAKLTGAMVEKIRKRYAAGGVTQRQLAKEAGVTHQAVSKIVTGARWTNVGQSA